MDGQKDKVPGRWFCSYCGECLTLDGRYPLNRMVTRTQDEPANLSVCCGAEAIREESMLVNLLMEDDDDERVEVWVSSGYPKVMEERS